MNTPALPEHAPEYLQLTSALAMEIAAQLSPPLEVFARHGFDEEQAKVILQDDVFRKLVKEAQAEWKADQNTGERIKLKAQMALEELLLPTYNLARDPKVPPPSRTDAVKLFERLSGVGKQTEESGGGGPKFVLSINIGQDEPKQIEGAVIEQDG